MLGFWIRIMTVPALVAFPMLIRGATSESEGWPSFQNGGQLALQLKVNPRVRWSPQEGIAWRAKLVGFGQSTPVAESGIVYVTSTSGENKQQLHVQAFDQQTGNETWQFTGENSSPEENSNYISRAAPSPVCDSEGVIALFEGGNIFALTPSGEIRWQRDLAADYGPIESRHGLAASLEQNQQYVFAWIERNHAPYVVALEKSTGATAWKAKGLGTTSWSSPRLIPVENGQHLVLSGVGQLVGLDPSSGERLWQFDDISGNSTPTPVPVGNAKFLIGATVGRGRGGGGEAAKSNGLVRISSDSDGTFSAKFVWRAERATSSFGSPLAYDGLAYFVNRSGVVYGLDLETGREQFVRRTPSSVWATPLAIDDRIYFFGKDGSTTVIAVGPQFKSLATNSLWPTAHTTQTAPGTGQTAPPRSSILYAVAVADGDILLRTGQRLYLIDSPRDQP